MYPLVEASSGQEWYYFRSAQHLVSLWVRLTFSQIKPSYPQLLPPNAPTPGPAPSPSRDISWPSALLLWAGWPLVRLFSIAFLICDFKNSSSKVVPLCSNTLDWQWKDMSKFVWWENSLYNISWHVIQEYVLRWCRYKTANGPWK